MLITVFNVCFEGYTLYVAMFIESDDVNVNNSLMHFVIIHFVSKRFKRNVYHYRLVPWKQELHLDQQFCFYA